MEITGAAAVAAEAEAVEEIVPVVSAMLSNAGNATAAILVASLTMARVAAMVVVVEVRIV